MNKIFKILILSIFVTGFLTSAICLVCASPLPKNCCHGSQGPASSGNDDCATHCLKQKVFAVNAEGQALETPRDFNRSLKFILTPDQILPANVYSSTGLYRIYSLPVNLNTGRDQWFTPLLNHAPPFTP